MNMADAAEQVLRQSDQELTPREITDRALADGLISPHSNKPWVYMAAAIRKDNRRRKERDETARFTVSSTGHYRFQA